VETEDGTMVRTATTVETRRDSSLKLSPPRDRAGGFKPVALPAVAAAVQVARKEESRKPARREVPAVLRELGALD
jgi:transposase-like protein